MLTFDEATHTYRLGDEELPSVTTILKPLSSYGDVPMPILEAAAERGTRVHRAVELLCQDRLDWTTVDDELIPYLEAWLAFCDAMRPEFIATEKRTYHPTAKYAGTLDLELVLHGKPKAKLAVLDVKSCIQVMPTTGPQTAAYQHAENATRKKAADQIKERYALRLGRDGKFDLIPYAASPVADLNDFMACLRVLRFKQQNHRFYKDLAA
ncbi:hypothetical protein BJP27_24290 (plasmid) [Pseudomonas oryzihabitans]|nr:hypothetical protein BJP27_24290 [Pseudomonas psychrotolerans]